MGTQVHTAISATMATGIRMPLATHMRTGTVPGTLPKRVMEKQMRTLTPRKTEFLMHGRTLCMGTEVMDAMAMATTDIMDMVMHHIGMVIILVCTAILERPNMSCQLLLQLIQIILDSLAPTRHGLAECGQMSWEQVSSGSILRTGAER